MSQQASYIFTADGSTYAALFDDDMIVAAIEAEDPTPDNLIPYVEQAAVAFDGLLVEQLNAKLAFGGAAEIDHLGTLSV